MAAICGSLYVAPIAERAFEFGGPAGERFVVPRWRPPHRSVAAAVHPPVAVMVTSRPDVAVAVTVNVVANVAGLARRANVIVCAAGVTVAVPGA